MGTTQRSPRPLRDDLPTVKMPPLRRSGAVTLLTQSVQVFDGHEVRVRHTLFGNGGNRSFFICPSCANLAWKVRLLEGRVTCNRCDGGLHYRCQHNDKSGRIARLQYALYGPNPHRLHRKRLVRHLRKAQILQRRERLAHALQAD